MKTTISIFGDSITYGEGDHEKGGWVRMLSNYYKEYDKSIEIFNHGISGDTTENLLGRFQYECSIRSPQIIFFAIGINDSMYFNTKENSAVSLEKFQRNLEELVNEARIFTDRIILIGLTKVDESKVAPIPWEPTIYYDNSNIQQYNSVIKEVCLKNNLHFIDVFDSLETTDLDDGLHPNHNGYLKMFVKINEFMIKNQIIM